MKHPWVGRSDLVRMLVGGPALQEFVARQLGFEFRPDDPPPEPTRDISNSAGSAALPAQPVAVRQTQYRPAAIPFWRAEELLVRKPVETELELPPVTEPRRIPRPLAFEPLAPWSYLAARLRRAAGRHALGRTPDVRRLVRNLAAGKTLREIPRRRVRGFCSEFHLVVDNATRLTPYREDQQQVATELLQQLPSHQLTLSVLYPEGERPIVEEPASRRGQLFEPTSGGAVLALTDLGSLAGDSGESAAFWGRLGVWLAHRGCQRIALVPCRICDVPESLAALWQLIPWERSSGATVTEHGLTADAFTQLMASLSQAGRIEPRLLRHVRKLLKRVLAHAGLEGRFWSHGDLYGRHPAGATLRADAAERWRQLARQLSPELRAETLEAIFNAHGEDYAGIWKTEVLNLGSDAARFVPAQEIQAARDWHAAGEALIGPAKPSDPELRPDFFQRVQGWYSYAGVQTHGVLRQIVAHLRTVNPGSEVPPNFDPAWQASTNPLQTVPIVQRHDRFQFGSATEGTATSAGLSARWLADVQLRDTSVRLEEIRPFDINHDFWADGTPPRWASQWGIDEFGPWVEFEVPREGQSAVVQRMRWIPPGEFLMGSPEGEPGRWENEGPQHLVTLTCGFWMWDTPCTQALWTAVMSGNPSRFPTPDRPVEQVSWEDCGQFFVRLHAVVAGLAAGLPTEAEWEYACRAGATSATYAGAMEILGLNNAPVLDSIAWYGGNSGMDYELKNGLDAIKWPEKQYEFRLAGTHPVGRKSSNSYGLFDMLGNVWEWCADAWDEYSEGPSADPLPSSDEATPLRVARGGSWGDYARGVRAACRDSSVLSRCLDYLGFRGRVHGCEPSQPAQQAEQRTERAVSRRSGQAEPRADDSPASAGRRAVWVNLHAGGVPSIPTPAGQTVRIVSDVQQLTLRAAPKPFWAAAIGRDRFGLWCEFDLPRPVGMPPAPGRPRARQGVVTQRLRWIPPGQFLMGSPRDEPGRHANEPEPTVTTIHKGFWLFDTPCTQELWETVTGENPSFFKSPTRPVEQVRWYDCVEFGRRLRERIPEIVGELPSVAEWEYACRAGTQTATYAGPLEILGVANAPALDPIAWYAGNAGVEFELQNGVKNNRASVKQYNYNVAGTHPVALKLPNAWGLYDTLGNVWEWCSDAWSEPAERRAAALHDETQSAPLRVVRGGSWDGDARYVQAASSTFFKPSRRLYYLGFRCRVQECEPSQPGSERADRSEQAAAPSVAEQEGAAGAASADRHAGHSTNG